MEEIMYKENVWDHMAEASVVEGSIEKVNPKEMAIAMKPGKAAGPFEIFAEMICNFANVHWIEKEYWINGKQMCWY